MFVIQHARLSNACDIHKLGCSTGTATACLAPVVELPCQPCHVAIPAVLATPALFSIELNFYSVKLHTAQLALRDIAAYCL